MHTDGSYTAVCIWEAYVIKKDSNPGTALHQLKKLGILLQDAPAPYNPVQHPPVFADTSSLMTYITLLPVLSCLQNAGSLQGD